MGVNFSTSDKRKKLKLYKLKWKTWKIELKLVCTQNLRKMQIFSEYFAYVLNEWSGNDHSFIHSNKKSKMKTGQDIHKNTTNKRTFDSVRFFYCLIERK